VSLGPVQGARPSDHISPTTDLASLSPLATAEPTNYHTTNSIITINEPSSPFTIHRLLSIQIHPDPSRSIHSHPPTITDHRTFHHHQTSSNQHISADTSPGVPQLFDLQQSLNEAVTTDFDLNGGLSYFVPNLHKRK
jgi:hypothetical protein